MIFHERVTVTHIFLNANRDWSDTVYYKNAKGEAGAFNAWPKDHKNLLIGHTYDVSLEKSRPRKSGKIVVDLRHILGEVVPENELVSAAPQKLDGLPEVAKALKEVSERLSRLAMG